MIVITTFRVMAEDRDNFVDFLTYCCHYIEHFIGHETDCKDNRSSLHRRLLRASVILDDYSCTLVDVNSRQLIQTLEDEKRDESRDALREVDVVIYALFGFHTLIRYYADKESLNNEFKSLLGSQNNNEENYYRDFESFVEDDPDILLRLLCDSGNIAHGFFQSRPMEKSILLLLDTFNNYLTSASVELDTTEPIGAFMKYYDEITRKSYTSIVNNLPTVDIYILLLLGIATIIKNISKSSQKPETGHV